ncbi:FHA domain-containing protein [Simulacricoccus sp. 17bor-14]|nr:MULTISPECIES: FHA domain-containing protein [Myxococcaceae]MBF5041125.1 FHA domain-containing protein [Simulacricoccus sp. 17bor-14]
MSQLLLSSLAVVCPNCDGYNPPQSAACQACGTSLGAPARGAPAAVSTFPKAGEAPRPTRPPESVPPGLRPSARTPPPAPSGLATVPPRAPAPAAPPPRTASAAGVPASPPRTASSPAAPTAAPPRTASAAGVPAAPAPLVGRALTPPAARTGLAPAGTAAAAPKFGLAVLAGASRGQRYRLPLTGCVVGRTRGALLLAEDPYVSPLHATFVVKDGALFVRDESSTSGVYVTIAGTESLAPHGLFAVGQRAFRYVGLLEAPPPLAGRPLVYGAPVPSGQALYAVEEVLVGGRPGRAVTTAGPMLTVGQTHCDLSYPQDESLAVRHCELSPHPSGATLRDLSGGLGTYVRIPPLTERPLRAGDRVRMGQHVLQVELLG